MNQPTSPYRLPSGGKKPLLLKLGGDYHGDGPGPHVSLSGHQQGDVCAFLKANNLTLQDVLLVNGYRGIQANDQRGIKLLRVVVRGSGTPHARMGNDFFFVNVHDLEMRDCRGLESQGSHCVYLSNWNGGTTENVLIHGGEYATGPGSVASALQINSESGGKTKNIHIDGATFKTDGRETVLNLLGAGVATDPVTFTRCPIIGGKRAVVVSNFAAGRPSYVVLQDCPVTGDVVVEGRSRLVLKGSTKVSGQVTTSGGGAVVRQ